MAQPVRQLADCDHRHEDETDDEHDEDGLLAFLGGRLDCEQMQHGERLSHRSTVRSANDAEVFPNSHQPCTAGRTNAVLRPYTSGMSATFSAIA